jgi:hypothetical protein
MTPSQQKLAEIDARWALEAQAERQRLVDTIVRSVETAWWWRCLWMVGVAAIVVTAGYFFDDRQDRVLWTWALMALFVGGMAVHAARYNARRIDALVKLLKIDGKATEKHV